MAKTKREIINDLKLIDIVIELLDSRIPVSSQNPDIARLTAGKKRIIVLNKSDLANEKQNRNWVEHFAKKGIPAVIVDSNKGAGIKEVISKIEEITKEEREKQATRGRIGKNIRVIILGIPNVGKSSFINRITKKSSMTVGNKPGVTKQKQWIRIQDNIELLDTPGVLWPKFESEEVGLNLAFTGTIKDDIIDKTEITYHLLKLLYKNYKQNLTERYKLENQEIENIFSNETKQESTKILDLLNLIGKKRGAILSGGRIDEEKTATIILDDFRSGKLGKITIERVE